MEFRRDVSKRPPLSKMLRSAALLLKLLSPLIALLGTVAVDSGASGKVVVPYCSAWTGETVVMVRFDTRQSHGQFQQVPLTGFGLP